MEAILPWFGIAVSLISAGAIYGSMKSLMNAHGKRLDDLSGEIKEVVTTSASNTRKIEVLIERLNNTIREVDRLEQNLNRDRERPLRDTHDGIKL